MKKRRSKPSADKAHIVRYSAEEARRLPVRFNRAKVAAASDEEIALQIENDADTAPDLTTLPAAWRLPRGIRRKLGMTQEQIARLLHISVGTWRNWEQGRSEPYGPAAA